MADIDVNQVSFDLAEELNTDLNEMGTITSLVQLSIDIIKRSSDASDDDSLLIPAVKTLAQALYYDRSLADGMPRGLLMMLTHLQATSGGNANGS